MLDWNWHLNEGKVELIFSTEVRVSGALYMLSSLSIAYMIKGKLTCSSSSESRI
jgi:hypothetical protein